MKINALQIHQTINRGLSTGMLMLIASASHGVDLSNNPLVTSTATSVRPNIMFVLDDSGSMGSQHMPDYVADEAKCRDKNGWNGATCTNMDPPYYSAGYNGIYYNPLFTYKPPVNADGTSRPDQADWTQVQRDPYLNPTAKDNIVVGYADQYFCNQDSYNSTDTASLTNPAKCRRNGVAYTTAPVVAAAYNYPNSTFQYKKRNGGGGGSYLVGGAPYYYDLASVQWCSNTALTLCQARKDTNFQYALYGAFTRRDITLTNCPAGTGCPSGRTYAAEMTNFANWYAYYRTRLSMMKTGVGRAFANLDDNFRTGFMTIHTTPGDTSRYIPIQTFNAGQKTAWYNKLYSIGTTGSTPLRAALSTAGQMYAGSALTDPVQYSCQKNYTILSTDGMWNGGKGFKLDGSAIGNQDNNLSSTPRPKYDGNILPTTEAGSGVAGGAETLSDVAMYYYKTDLRDASLGNCTGALGSNVCLNNVPPSKKDPASHQHMTLFTIGLGVDGTLAYRPDYETASTGDFASIRAGAKQWPSAMADNLSAIDDLWHAAVNGGGTYYSAKNPQALSDGLGDALREVGGKTGAAAAASTSNPQVTTRDNYVFSSNYRTAFWDSVIKRRRIDTVSGELSKTVDWEAAQLLDAKVAAGDSRTIYMFDGSKADKLKPFKYSVLTVAEKAFLDVDSWPDPATKLSQWAGLSIAGQTAARAGGLMSYLRGQPALEDDIGDPNQPFRGRDSALGDIVNSETVYVKQPLQDYEEASYKAYVVAKKDRQAALYAAANDGMLHAFNADNGQEMWAYVPSQVIPKLYKLADKNYLHEFYVDGTPVVSDIYDGSNWRTILVGGLNNGGNGYYALDVTDPLAPKALWEICTAAPCSVVDANIGMSYGTPTMAKLTSGEWVVMVTSGYNNTDGKGYLYVLNPITGAKKYTIATGCTGANCGIGRFSAWITSNTDPTAERVYAGDLDGNLWRFDINDTIAPAGREAFKLARVGNPSGGLIQSITTKPELAMVDGHSAVFVGTGRLLGLSDKVDNTVNSMYAIKDDLTATERTNLRTGNLVKQTLAAGVSKEGLNIRTNTNNSVDWSAKSGWYVDYPDTGERSFTDPALGLGTLVFTTNVPTTSDPCSGGGLSWLYELDWKTGGAVNTAEKTASGALIATKFLANEFATRPVLVQLPNGKVIELIQINAGDRDVSTSTCVGCSLSSVVSPEQSHKFYFLGRRAGWREIINDRGQ